MQKSCNPYMIKREKTAKGEWDLPPHINSPKKEAHHGTPVRNKWKRGPPKRGKLNTSDENQRSLNRNLALPIAIDRRRGYNDQARRNA